MLPTPNYQWGVYSDPELDALTETTPSDISIGEYYLPGYFGKAETEEAAARLIAICQTHGVWVGVSWSFLLTQIDKDQEDHNRTLEIRRQHHDDCQAHDTAMAWWRVFAVITLGIYTFFVQRPAPPRKPEEPSYPISLVYHMGSRAVSDGFLILMNKWKYVRIVRDSEEHGMSDTGGAIIYPTPELIAFMAAKQGLIVET